MKTRTRILTLSLAAIFLAVWPVFAADREEKPASEKQPAVTAKKERPKDVEKPFRMEEIVVTADKRPQPLGDLARSITVYTRKNVESAGARDLDRVARLTPGLFLTQSAPGISQYNIRGVGSASFGESALSIYVDGMLIPGLTSGSFYDVERIEILKGPQGTLYGPNSQAGVINIITRKPTEKPFGEVVFSLGSYNSRVSSAVVSGPLQNRSLLFRQAVQYKESDGYYENTVTGESGENIDEFLSLTKLLWKIDKKSEASFSMYCRRGLNGYDSWADINELKKHPFKTTSDSNGFSNVDVFAGALKYRRKAERFTITSTTVYSSSRSVMMDDLSFVPIPLFPINTIEIGKHYFTASEEIRLASKKKKGAPLEWVAGLFFQHQKMNGKTVRDLTIDFGGGPVPVTVTPLPIIESDSCAAFGQATWKTTEKLELTLGARIDVQRRDFDWMMIQDITGMGVFENSTTASVDYVEALPRAAAAWKWTPETKTWLSVTRGYKAGGFNTAAETEEEAETPFDPEFFWHYELGLKGRAKKGKIKYACSLFYIDFRDQQVPSFDNAAFHFKNAGESFSRGAEMEIKARPSKAWEFHVSAAATQAEFEKFVDAHGNDFAGKRFPGTPKNHWKIGAAYRRPSGLTCEIELAGIGDLRLDDYNEIHQDAYQLLSARVGIEKKTWSVFLWGKNLLDEEYLVRGFGPSTVGGLPLSIGRLGPPLTIGLDFKAGF